MANHTPLYLSFSINMIKKTGSLIYFCHSVRVALFSCERKKIDCTFCLFVCPSVCSFVRPSITIKGAIKRDLFCILLVYFKRAFFCKMNGFCWFLQRNFFKKTVIHNLKRNFLEIKIKEFSFHLNYIFFESDNHKKTASPGSELSLVDSLKPNLTH